MLSVLIRIASWVHTTQFHDKIRKFPLNICFLELSEEFRRDKNRFSHSKWAICVRDSEVRLYILCELYLTAPMVGLVWTVVTLRIHTVYSLSPGTTQKWRYKIENSLCIGRPLSLLFPLNFGSLLTIILNFWFFFFSLLPDVVSQKLD